MRACKKRRRVRNILRLHAINIMRFQRKIFFACWEVLLLLAAFEIFSLTEIRVPHGYVWFTVRLQVGCSKEKRRKELRTFLRSGQFVIIPWLSRSMELRRNNAGFTLYDPRNVYVHT